MISLNLDADTYKVTDILKRLFDSYIKTYSKKVILAIFFMVISAICSTIIVDLVKPLIDKVFLKGDQTMAVFLPLIVIATFSTKGIAEYYQNYLIKFIGQRVLTDLQMDMYRHLLFADIAFIQSQSSGRLISRFTNDISMMRGAVSNLLVGCAKHLLSVIFLIGLMFWIEPLLSSIVFIAFPLVIYPVQKLGKKIRKISATAQEELGHYTSKLDETFQSIKIVKSFSGEQIEANRALVLVTNILNFYKKTAKLDALVSPLMEILSGLAISGIIWYGSVLIIEGKTTPGTLITFITAFASAYRPFKSLVSLNVNLQEGIAAARRVFTILDFQPQIKDHAEAQDIDLRGAEIIFNDVELKFHDKIALRKVNFKLPAHKIIAIVGRSGSGKTSIGNLLVRFYNADNGKILLNNHDINDISIASLRSQIALVTQDTHLFDISVAENIAYGTSTVTREQIITAAKYADADEFISNLPQGYDTIIGNQGATLSGGQRQRLSIARAFLKNAPILIWDEATSSLDQNSEAKILNSLREARKDFNTLIITHRLTSIIDVDHIIVMKSGIVCEEGTHAQLLKKGGEYHKLYTKELREND